MGFLDISPTVDIFIVWLLQNALPIALFQLQPRKEKYQLVLHLTHDRNAITFEALQIFFSAQCKDLRAFRSFM